MRLAWHGPTPTDDGVGYAATMLVSSLHDAGVEIDCFLSASDDSVPRALRERDVRVICMPPKWKWDRWYSRTPLLSFVSGQAARAAVQRRLMEEISRRHAVRPYDFLYQFSQIELFGVRRMRSRLPEIVLHPEAHSAGELAWHRKESALARSSESLARHAMVRTMLVGRAARQRRDIKLARLVIAPSERFATYLSDDYGVAETKLAVVPNPIDLDRFRPPEHANGSNPLELLFVSRMAVRKGVDMIVSLSERVRDLAGRIRITAIGGPSLFSDYRPLLTQLNTDVAQYVGGVEPYELPEIYRRAAVVLQLSHYEPFALTVGEGLASGLTVVASDEVGATEDVSPEVCRTFHAGDIDAFQTAVRGLVSDLASADARKRLSAIARAEAERLYDPSVVAAQLATSLEAARGIHVTGVARS